MIDAAYCVAIEEVIKQNRHGPRIDQHTHRHTCTDNQAGGDSQPTTHPAAAGRPANRQADQRQRDGETGRY